MAICCVGWQNTTETAERRRAPPFRTTKPRALCLSLSDFHSHIHSQAMIAIAEKRLDKAGLAEIFRKHLPA